MDGREPIAVVGLGCRLPGGVHDADSLWRLLVERVDAITPVPASRFDVEELLDTPSAPGSAVAPGRMVSRWGGFVDEVESFDAAFFELGPRQAELVDPQHRLLMETAWEALEDAGVPRELVAGTDAGVFMGLWTNEYERRAFADAARLDFHATTGTGRYAASGRISYLLDLAGPSVTIDTHCSSSLVAVHLACQSLLTDECDLALAGGANVVLEPFVSIAYSQSQMLAADGRCKFGDASADGYVRSDGAVVFALKRLSTAQADGDHIRAVIAASAVANDGCGSGAFGTPGRTGQERLLRRTYVRAGIDPATVQYVEAHGTGTAAGDPVELAAIGAVLGRGSGRTDTCLVGSIKTNIGHAESAAGAAGLAKVVLALQHRQIPSSLHCAHPSPEVPWDVLGVEVVGATQPWPAATTGRRAAVSGFGIAGTNAHVVVEEAPAVRPPARADVPARGTMIVPVSAASVAAASATAQLYAARLESGRDIPTDVCAAAATQRSHLRNRIAVVGADASDLAAALRAAQARHWPVDAGRRIVLVFPGQGSQWSGMARDLLHEPSFAAAMDRCDTAMRAEAGWSPLDLLRAGQSLEEAGVDVVQPLLFAVQVSLAAMWRSWGIEPVAVVGHSMGEVAAATVAGAISTEDAVAVICRRSALLKRIAGSGAMAFVDLGRDDAAAAIASREGSLSVAVSNGPRSTVISGDPAALDEVLAELASRQVFCRLVKVDVASHSPQVDPLLDELTTALTGVTAGAPATPMRSTVTGRWIETGELDSAYWAANLRRPVMFGDAIAELLAVGPTAFVEVSPHPVLVTAVKDLIAGADDAGVVVSSMRRDEDGRASMLSALATLYECGADVDWPAVTGRPAQHVDLPHYPWQRERHWLDRGRFGVPLAEPIRSAPAAAATTAPVPASLLDTLRSEPVGPRRRRVVEDALAAELADVLRLDVARIDRRRALKELGVDSLLALELRNRLERLTGLELSGTLSWNQPTVALLAAHVAGRLGVDLAAVPPDPLRTEPLQVDASTVPDDDLGAMLAAELEIVDRLLGDGRSR